VKFSSLYYRSVFLKIRSKRVDEERKRNLKFSKYDYYLMIKVYSLRQQFPDITEEEIAARLSVKTKEVHQAICANFANKQISLDQVTAEGDAYNTAHTFAELISSGLNMEVDILNRLGKEERLERLLVILPERHRTILMLLLDGKKQKDIATIMDITQNKVYKSIKKIVNFYILRIDSDSREGLAQEVNA
jgi:DNA-directed RNA polymerase specialized sigma subunit